MEIERWLAQLKTDQPQLDDFITKLEPFISDTGFNAIEFERRVNTGILNATKAIDNLFNSTEDAENQ